MALGRSLSFSWSAILNKTATTKDVCRKRVGRLIKKNYRMWTLVLQNVGRQIVNKVTRNKNITPKTERYSMMNKYDMGNFNKVDWRRIWCMLLN